MAIADSVATDDAELAAKDEAVFVASVLVEAVNGGEWLARLGGSTIGDTILVGSGVGALPKAFIACCLLAYVGIRLDSLRQCDLKSGKCDDRQGPVL